MIVLIQPLLFALSFGQNIYNFPMEVGEMNVIYLKEYLPTELQAPNYQITSNNDFNLTIEQSILLLDSQLFPQYLQIRCGSNYISDYGTNTNLFWFLTMNNDLYQGLILDNGSLEINLTNIGIQKLNCFSINLLQANYGILTCYQSKSYLLTFLLVNSSSSETQILNTDQQIVFYLGEVPTSITQQDGKYNIILTNINNTNVMVYNYSLQGNNLTFLGLQNFQGNYKQALISQQQNFIFLLQTQSIDIVNLNTGVNSSLNFEDYQLQNIAVYQFSENIFQIALYQSSLIITFLYDFRFGKQLLSLSSKTLIESSTFVYLSVQPLKVFIVTDQYVAQLLIEEFEEPRIENYVNLFPISYAFINENRQIAILFLIDQNTSQYSISSYYFNEPQIQISSFLSSQIYFQFNNYLISFTITSGITSQQETIILDLTPVNQTKSTCPITFKQKYENVTLEFPETLLIPYSDVFIGPNITRTVYVSQANVTNAVPSNQLIYSILFKTGFTYSVVCASFHNIAIYCSQFQNKSILIQQTISAQQTYLINNSQTLEYCQCYNDEESLTVLFQFSNNILIQYFDIWLQPTQQLKFQYSQSILSSHLFYSQLFLIFQDGSLSAYTLKDNNQTTLFQVSGFGLYKIYTNRIAYPNYLFLDNKTNLLILYYNNQNNYQIINQIPYPKTVYNQSAFGILRNGIFLSIYDQTTPPYSFLYYYPKQNIFYSQPSISYFQFNMMGFNYIINPIQSGYSSQRYYVNLLDSKNICCYHTILQGSGTPFTVFEFQSIPTAQLKQYSVYESISSKQDLILILAQSGLTLNGTMNSGIYTIYSLFSQTNMNNVTQYYSAKNPGCKKEILITQNFTVIQNKSLIMPKNYNSELFNVDIELSANSSFYIQPQQLFYGNIESYNVTCDQCQSFSYSTPTSNSSFITVNITYQTAVQQGDVLYIQDNQSLYYIANETQLTKVYDFPEQYPTCNSLFFEKVSSFPISICHNSSVTTFFAFNTSSNEIITNSSLNLSSFRKSDYNNGIIQIFSKYQNSYLNYYSYYIWIAESQINFVPIYISIQLPGYAVYLEFIYLKLSKNFSSNPCQVFGFSETNHLINTNPMFFILKSCVPSVVSQAFGFPSNLYTNVTNIYSKNVTWYLAQTFQGQFFMPEDVLQIGENQFIGSDLVDTFFITYVYAVPRIYKLTFNLTNGVLLYFRKQANLFTVQVTYIFSYWSSTGLLGCFQEINSTNFILSIYPPFSQSNYENVEIVYMIGVLNQNASYQNSNNTIHGDYFIRYGDVASTTMIFKLQNQVKITADLGVNESAQMILMASNYFSSSTQALQLANLDYILPQPIPQPIDDDEIGSHIGLIFAIIAGTTLFILMGILIYRYCKKKHQDQSNLENKFIEMK